MNNNLPQIFENPEFGQIRVIEINGEGWLVGRDIAEVLKYLEPHKAIIRHVDEEDRMKHPILSVGGKQVTWVINESGLYSLVLSSKLPLAKKFKRWVTSEVLQSIRKHGIYMTPETIEKILFNPDSIIKIATKLKSEREEKLKLKKQIEEDRPYTHFAKSIANSSDCITIGEFAKICNNNGVKIGRNRLFEWLRNNDFLIKSGKEKNNPKQHYVEQGLFQLIERTIHAVDGDLIRTTTLITGKGQLYFLEKLKDEFGEKVS